MSGEKGISPNETLVILLGASEWPEAPDYKSSVAFVNSVKAITEYFTGKFGLAKENLHDLFDSEKNQDDILRSVEAFISNRRSAAGPGQNNVKNLIVYFAGHGGFEGTSSDYYLAVRHSTAKNLRSSAIHIQSLALTLKNCAASLRQLIILDACFAASAAGAFQSGLAQNVMQKTKDAFYEPGKATEEVIPESGTTLLCSSNSNDPSKIADDQSYTKFSEALAYILNHGNKKARKFLTIKEIGDFTWEYLSQTYKDDAPKPEVHSPNQAYGDVATMPFFPNYANQQENNHEIKEFIPSDALQCCIFLSETEENKKWLETVVSRMLRKYKTEILQSSGKTAIEPTVYVVKISKAFSSKENYRNAIKALSICSIAVFDLTNYEPAAMLFMGIRSVVRRGVTVASVGSDYVIGDLIDFPFNIKEVNVIAHSEKQTAIKDPIDIIGERVVEGFKQLSQMSNYLDLPTFDAVRNITVDNINNKPRDYSEQILMLCSFSKNYQENNWLKDFKISLNISVRESIKDNQGKSLPAGKPNIIRTLDIKTPRLVSQCLYEEIRLTKMCVVDWTEWKPNIFFELGVRISVHDIDPVCVIAGKHKQLISDLQQGKKYTDDKLPPGIDPKDIPRIEKTLSQCVSLLEWFDPIVYDPTTAETGEDSEAFKNMIAHYDKLIISKNKLDQPDTQTKKDSTYDIISEVIDWQVEDSARPVHVDLINKANLMNSPEIETTGISPVLYPRNSMLVQKADQGALERRIAAWLYIYNRFSIEQIAADRQLNLQYSDLGNLIFRSLLDSSNENDQRIVENVRGERAKLKALKKLNL